MADLAEPVVTLNAIRTCIYFDNLRHCMREAFYRCVEAGLTPTHWVAGREALIGYEGFCEQNDPPVTMFKGLPGTLGLDLPGDRLEFRRDGRVVAVLTHIN